MNGTKLIAAAFLSSASTAALAESAPAGAANDTPVPKSAQADEGVQMAQVDPILVTGQRGTYGARATRTATKTDTRIIDIPQALTIISERQVEDQALRSVGELLYFVPGATPGTGEANRDQITLRGNNTTADLFIDGIRDDAQYFRDFYNVERVEVLKGPNAMIFGRGGGGGIVNRVIKRSTLGNYREGLLSSDSFGGLRGAIDIDQALGGTVGVRLNGVYEDGNSFRRHVDLERYGINPTVGVAIGNSTRLDLGYEYFHDRRTTDRGIPSLAGRPLKGFDRNFFGDPEKSFARADVNVASLAVEHRFAEGLTLRNRTLLADYDKYYANVFPNGAVLPASGTLPEGVVLGAYNSRNDRRNLFSQTDLVWESRLGGNSLHALPFYQHRGKFNMFRPSSLLHQRSQQLGCPRSQILDGNPHGRQGRIQGGCHLDVVEPHHRQFVRNPASHAAGRRQNAHGQQIPRRENRRDGKVRVPVRQIQHGAVTVHFIGRGHDHQLFPERDAVTGQRIAVTFQPFLRIGHFHGTGNETNVPVSLLDQVIHGVLGGFPVIRIHCRDQRFRQGMADHHGRIHAGNAPNERKMSGSGIGKQETVQLFPGEEILLQIPGVGGVRNQLQREVSGKGGFDRRIKFLKIDMSGVMAVPRDKDGSPSFLGGCAVPFIRDRFDEGAPSLFPDQIAFPLQFVQRPGHGREAQIVLLHQLVLGKESVTDAELSIHQLLFEKLDQFFISREIGGHISSNRASWIAATSGVVQQEIDIGERRR